MKNLLKDDSFWDRGLWEMAVLTLLLSKILLYDEDRILGL